MHGTIKRTEITCKKISCYMHDSAYRWFIVEILKYFEVILNIFEFSHVKEIVEFWLVYEIVESWLVDVNKFHESSNHFSWPRQ